MPQHKVKGATADLTGKVFVRWQAVKFLGYQKYCGKSKIACWLCRCTCGSGIEKQIRAVSLITGTATSCGCLRREVVSKQKRLKDGESGFNQLLGNYKRGAAARGLSWNISKKHFRYLTQQLCHYCGAAPSNKSKRKLRMDNGVESGQTLYVYNGIDRVKNSVGYTKSNCVASCKRCNTIKLEMTENEMYAHLEKMLVFRSKRLAISSNSSTNSSNEGEDTNETTEARPLGTGSHQG